jgi:glutamate formiminotransferase/formiminotetrahydrofolate cyclodeaminase
VDEDTESFNRILEAYRLPKDTEEEKALRTKAIQTATKGAIDTPYRCAEIAVESMEVMKAMAEIGMKSSITDAAVGAMCARTAARAAFYNARINCADYSDREYVDRILVDGHELMKKAEELENEILSVVETKM